jgi:hypothetical protein
MDYHSPDSATLTQQMDCYWTHVWNLAINKLPRLNIVRLGNNKQWTLSRLSRTDLVYCRNLNHPTWHCSSIVQRKGHKEQALLEGIHIYFSDRLQVHLSALMRRSELVSEVLYEQQYTKLSNRISVHRWCVRTGTKNMTNQRGRK